MIFFDIFLSATENSTENLVNLYFQLENIHTLFDDRKMRSAILTFVELIEVMPLRINKMRFENSG